MSKEYLLRLEENLNKLARELNLLSFAESELLIQDSFCFL